MSTKHSHLGQLDDKAERHAAVDELTLTTALLYFRMRKAAEDMLGEGKQSAGRRSILKSLASGGPQTVPQMARARAVSRQHIQKLVHGLRADGLVDLLDNPAHRRSRLVSISDAGRRECDANARREVAIFAELSEGLSLEEIRSATKVLLHLKTVMESDRWSQLAARR